MRSVNKSVLLGSLGSDPSMNQTQSGKAVANFSVAVDSGFGDRKSTYWARCTVWGKAAEIINTYAKKGDRIYVECEMSEKEWDDKKSGHKRTRTEHTVREFVLLGNRKGDGGAEGITGEGEAPDTSGDNGYPAGWDD